MDTFLPSQLAAPWNLCYFSTVQIYGLLSVDEATENEAHPYWMNSLDTANVLNR